MELFLAKSINNFYFLLLLQVFVVLSVKVKFNTCSLQVISTKNQIHISSERKGKAGVLVPLTWACWADQVEVRVCVSFRPFLASTKRNNVNLCHPRCRQRCYRVRFVIKLSDWVDSKSSS